MAVAIPLRRGGARPLDAGAFTAALYRDHAAELLRFAWHRLGRLEDAEDAVQTTFLSAHRVLQDGEDVREPRAWLFRILRNECLTRLAMTKRRGVHEELGDWHADARASVAEQAESNDEFDTAVALLATLPVQQREAMVLREWLGMSAIETAAVLDVTPQGVDALVYRARKALVGLGEVEAAGACRDVRQALADHRANASVRAHLLTCRGCRAAARRLHAPEELAAANSLLPLDLIASRIGESIPGFLGAGAAAAAIGGGTAVAATIAGGTAVKVVSAVAIGAVVAGGAVRGAPALEHALEPALRDAPVRAAAAPAQVAAVPVSADGAHRIVAPPPQRATGELSVDSRPTGPSSAHEARPAMPGAAADGAAGAAPMPADEPIAPPAVGAGVPPSHGAGAAAGAASEVGARGDAAGDDIAAIPAPPRGGAGDAGGGGDAAADERPAVKPPRSDDGEAPGARGDRGRPGGSGGESAGAADGPSRGGIWTSPIAHTESDATGGRGDGGRASGDDARPSGNGGRPSGGDARPSGDGGARTAGSGKGDGRATGGDERPGTGRGGSGRGDAPRGER